MRGWGMVLVLALGLAACERPPPERPPMPKTGQATQGTESAPVVKLPQDETAPTRSGHP